MERISGLAARALICAGVAITPAIGRDLNVNPWEIPVCLSRATSVRPGAVSLRKVTTTSSSDEPVAMAETSAGSRAAVGLEALDVRGLRGLPATGVRSVTAGRTNHDQAARRRRWAAIRSISFQGWLSEGPLPSDPDGVLGAP